MSRITISDLEVFYRIGVTAEERAQPQRLLITVELDFDFAAAASSDRVEETINYFTLSQELLTFGKDRSWNLIERLATNIADLVLSRYQPQAVTVQVKKFPIPQANHVAVSITKSKPGTVTVKSP
jgi:dihydroneopterin aldolase